MPRARSPRRRPLPCSGVDAIRRHKVATMDALVPHFPDENRMLSVAKAGRDELENSSVAIEKNSRRTSEVAGIRRPELLSPSQPPVSGVRGLHLIKSSQKPYNGNSPPPIRKDWFKPGAPAPGFFWSYRAHPQALSDETGPSANSVKMATFSRCLWFAAIDGTGTGRCLLRRNIFVLTMLVCALE